MDHLRQTGFLGGFTVLIAAIAVGRAAAAEPPQRVAVRVDKYFVRAAADGTLVADRNVPGESEIFELVSGTGDQRSLRASNGRFLTLAVDGRSMRALGPTAVPGPRESLLLAEAGENRYRVRLASWPKGAVLSIAGTSAGSSLGTTRAVGQSLRAPRDVVEIFRISEVPLSVQTTLLAGMQGLANEELAGKKYDKTRAHKTEKFIDLPAPTLKDLKRTKRHQILGIGEQYRLQAEVEGQVKIGIERMPYLRPLKKEGSGILFLAIDVSLPVHGHVQYQVDKLLSATSGYQTTVNLTAVAEVAARRTGGDVVLAPPRILDVTVSLRQLRFSNDILDSVRRQIERLLNHELRQNEDRIRAQADQALLKASKSRDFRLPLVGYLGLF